MFQITAGRGFHITFENGYKFSCQWGSGNYCDARDFEIGTWERERERAEEGSATAEIAVFDPSGAFVRISEFDDVIGWVTADQVAAAMAYVAQIDPEDPHAEALMAIAASRRPAE